MQTLQIANALGGARTFHGAVEDASELHEKVLSGLPYRAFEAVVERYGLDRAAVLKVLHVPPRTLARRKKAQRLMAEESDRLTRLARIVAMAEEVLGEPRKAGRWFQKSNRALGGAVPLEHVVTDIGTRQVEEVLGRIGHGVLS